MLRFPKIRDTFGLFFLVLILSVITFDILKPEFYLVGWDNFSSYLNLKSSMFNTIFSAWREHRGLGVPSDAEVTDIFRQIFSVLVSPISGKQIVDQLYYILMLWGGVLGMYSLGKHVSQRLKFSNNKQELFGFLSAFFYLFNLNTLAVFYFPMVMYVTRFFMLPTTIFILLKLMEPTKRSVWTYLFYLLILLVSSGSFMVPTVFVVFVIMLGLMILILGPKKRVLGVIGLYLVLNVFWLLPFVNYTKEKGAIVPQAPTFVEINESMLNKSKSFYTFERQSKLRPSFFESQFTNNQTQEKQFFHPLAKIDENGITRWILWTFPILYLGGIILSFSLRKDRVILWFASLTLLFLIFSMKEYSIVGPIYTFVSNTIPFANTIFRFGDTKFHPIIAFGGSIMSAYVLLLCITFLQKHIRSKITKPFVIGVLGGLIVANLFVFRTYFDGNFIGFFMYNKIPSPYFEIADIINNDSEAIRVIHLPLDDHSYWKPYTWGYFGSPFLHFMLNKPLFDRAFEPASLENADIHKQIMDIIFMTSSVPTDNLLKERAETLHNLLKSLSVKYIIDDQTISTTIETRNITYWGTIRPADSSRLLSYLENNGYIRLIKQFTVDSDDIRQDFIQLYPYNSQPSGDLYTPKIINLYALIDVQPRIQLLTDVQKVHSAESFLPSAIRQTLGSYIQHPQLDDSALVFPFAEKQSRKQLQDNQIELSLPITLQKGTYSIESMSNDTTSQTHLVQVSIQPMDSFVRVFIEPQPLPSLKGVLYQQEQQTSIIDIPTTGNSYTHLKVGEQVLPIQNRDTSIKHHLGSVMIHTTPIPISLLYPYKTYSVGDRLTQLEQNPQCVGDAQKDASSHVTVDNGVVTISGQNVSNCLTTEINTSSERTRQAAVIPYAELEFETSGTTKALLLQKHIDTGKPVLTEYITTLPNPLALDVCVKANDSTTCINKTRAYRIFTDKTNYSAPMSGDLNQVKKFLITFTVRNGQRQAYETQTTQINFKTYSSSILLYTTITPQQVYSNIFSFDKNSIPTLFLPTTVSGFSQNINLQRDGVIYRNDESCNKENTLQLMKASDQGIISLVANDAGQNCRNFLQNTIPFSSNNYYLWYATYKHFSGTIPTVILMDKLNTYSYLKLYPAFIPVNNYFSVPFQGPESMLTTKQTISTAIQKTPIYTINGFIEPKFDLQDSRNKELIIQHFSENEGGTEFQTLSLTELPNYWPNIKIRPVEYQPARFDSNAKITTYQRIIPSLWKVTMEAKSDGNYFVLFNENYDKQWIIIGARTIFHALCDGYVNCFNVELPKGITTFYFFYIPELLGLIGTLVTILVLMSGLIFFTPKTSRSKS